MRTTLTIADGLFAEAKKIAAESHRTLGAVIEDALRETFSRRKTPRAGTKVIIPVFKGDGVEPGINLDKTSELLDLTEKRHGPS